MKQTAVEYMYSIMFEKKGRISKEEYNQAKSIEKQQIMQSFKAARIPYKYDADLTLNGFEDAEQYYNETFKSE